MTTALIQTDFSIKIGVTDKLAGDKIAVMVFEPFEDNKPRCGRSLVVAHNRCLAKVVILDEVGVTGVGCPCSGYVNIYFI